MKQNLAPSGAKNQVANQVRQQYIDVSKKAKEDPRLANIEIKRREAQRKKAESTGGVPSVNNLLLPLRS
jgi:hypothetical protein